MLNECALTWLRALRVYIFTGAAFNLVWEIVQLPLYKAWTTANIAKLSYDVFHCTIGDTMIAAFCLLMSILVAGSDAWPAARFAVVSALTVTFGIVYTIFSEWHNTVITHAWAYAPSMPTILGIGVAPVAQWVVVPICTFWLLKRQLPKQK